MMGMYMYISTVNLNKQPSIKVLKVQEYVNVSWKSQAV